MKIPLIQGDGVDQSAQWTDGLLQNMYAVTRPVLGASGFVTTMPGLETAATVGDDRGGPDRGAIWVSTPNFIGQYRVSGESLVRVEDTDDLLDLLDPLGVIPGSDLVRMAYSPNNIAIVANKRLFYYNPTAGVREITGANVGDPIDITWGDSVFILTDGENIYHSDPRNEEDFLPLDFGSAEFQPDPALGVSWTENRELLVFGTLSIELFRNVGRDPFLFDPVRQKSQRIGIASRVSKAYYGSTYYMLGTRENSQFGVYVTGSGASEKISSTGIDKLLNSYERSEFQNSIVEVVEFDGTILCFIHLPDDKVICYNQSVARSSGNDYAWSILTSNTAENPSIQVPYRGYHFIHDKQLNRWYCGDKFDFRIGRVNPERGDQYGIPQECIMYSPFLKLETLSINKVELETVPGTGVRGVFFDPDGDPLEYSATMSVSLSEDGRIYSKEWFETTSEHNDYSTRYYVRRLGHVRNWVSLRFRTHTRTRQSFAAFDLDAT